ncbi:MAG TPA: hypothetical protein VGO43_10375 [Pyrinomonadaceae bacterium]|nr:hypothetical protein [Pyrinomonadaceae bacterium]
MLTFIVTLIVPAAVFSKPVRCTDHDTFVRNGVDELVRSAHAAYQDDETDGYDNVVGALVRAVRRCSLSDDLGFADRYPEFLDYINESSYAVLPDHELGFNVPDKQYFAETIQYLGIPEYLLEPRFLRDISRFETLARAKKYLESINASLPADRKLTFFSYTSRHLGTPDNNDSYRRLLIVVPGDPASAEPDKWVQFGVTDPGVRVRTRNVSVVAAVVRDDGSYDAYFKDYYRTYRRNGSINIRGRLELGEGDENCASCHKTGVLPIFPEAGSVPEDEAERVAAVNERFRSYGAPRFGGYIEPAKFGPGLGFGGEEYRTARFGGRFAETAVAGAMSCDRCHVPEKLGYLNWPMDRIIIDSFVKGGEMPRGGEIASAHRTQLYDKLVREYFDTSDHTPGVMKSWLLGRMKDHNSEGE